MPDADETGTSERSMMKVGGYLLALGCKVRIVDTSSKTGGWDLADALAEGWTSEQVFDWLKQNISGLTSKEVEAAEREAQKKTLQDSPQDPPQEHDLEDYEPVHVAQTIDVVPVEIADAPAIVSAKLTPHTGIERKEYMPDQFSEDGLARTWLANSGQDWSYTTAWNTWARWDGLRWKVDTTNSVTSEVSDEMARAGAWVEARNLSHLQIKSLSSKKNISNVIYQASCRKECAREPSHWDADPLLLGTPSGTLDLKTGILREARREDFITKFAACAPIAGPMHYWDMVLERCTGGDPEMRDYYQRWAYYFLTGLVDQECFLVVHGPQRSGKSKFIMALVGMLGQYSISADIALFMENKFDRHSSELAALSGARMIVASEPPSGARFNEAFIKKITGRERIQARRLYQDTFEFEMTGKVVMTTNYRPLLTAGEGMERRLHLAEFPPSIPEAEKIDDLDKRLEKEYPSIMAWAIAGREEFQRIGLSRPAQIKAAVDSYMEHEDTIGAWIDECCEQGAGHRTTSADLFASYQRFVLSGGEHPVGQKRLSQELERRGFNRVKSGGKRYLAGLRLTIWPSGV